MYLVKKLYSPDEEPKKGAETGKEPKSDKKPEQDSTLALAKALEEARKNSVSKEEFERVQKENRELVAQIINGEGSAGNGQQNPPEKADISKLREELYGPKSSNLSNLQFIQKTLELREAVIEQEGYDPFLPHGAKIKPTEYDAERADQVAKTFKECIEKADGNSEVFTALLQAEIANDSPTLTAHLKKLGLLK